MPVGTRTIEGAFAWLLIVLAFLGTGIGLSLAFRHGAADFPTLLSARLLFPVSALSTRWTDSFWRVSLWLTSFQFPAYAVLLSIGNLRNQLRKTALAIGTFHAAAIAACMLLI